MYWYVPTNVCTHFERVRACVCVWVTIITRNEWFRDYNKKKIKKIVVIIMTMMMMMIIMVIMMIIITTVMSGEGRPGEHRHHYCNNIRRYTKNIKFDIKNAHNNIHI